MGKYFGTDGIRGVANRDLDSHLVFVVGQAAAFVISEQLGRRPKFYIGRDTRESGDMLECALTAGLCSMGADVFVTGVLPTPAVAYITVQRGADSGAVISASHNPFEYNGVKFFNAGGYKLSDELEEKTEAAIDRLLADPHAIPLPTSPGRVRRDAQAAADYAAHVASAGSDYSGLRILVDCANGAAVVTAPAIFSALSAHADFIFCDPDGQNINNGCGSTHLEKLCSLVKAGGYDIGIAFDGDADRCLAVDENGCEINGDRIMAVCAGALHMQGLLDHDTLVVTILSNMGLHSYCHKNGMKVSVCTVGDRFVLEEMLRGGYQIGGEQSGHIIFPRYATTGDGEITAMQILNILKANGKKASEIFQCFEDYPQLMLNVPVPNDKKADVLASPELARLIDEAEAAFGGDGRVIVRPSGTEALVRVMAEGRDPDEVARQANRMADAIARMTD